MVETALQLVVIIFLGVASFGQPHPSIAITNEKQAEVLKMSSEHHIVFPYLVDNEGTFLSHNIHHRIKRSQQTTEVHYHIPFKNEEFHLELQPNNDAIIPGLQVEWISGKKTQADRNCHFIGSVRNYSRSSVAISNCRGLAGLIRAGQKKEFFIEPVLGIDPTDHGGKHAHVMYRRSIEEKAEKNRSEPACGVIVEDVVDNVDHFEKEPREERKILYLRRRDKRSVSLMKHVELLIVADYSMTKYYSSGDLQSYLLTIMNMKEFNTTVHAQRTLNTFCRWFQKKNPRSDLDPLHADAAVLITRKDICRDSFKPCRTLGLAFRDGMCSSQNECSYNEDNGFTVVYTIAHELGHNLGALHDDNYSNCVKLREHIMARELVVEPPDQLWSKCSRKAIRSFFYKGWGWCLNDQPGANLQQRHGRRLLPGERFDADAQCKMLFGSNSTICVDAEKDLCSTLWCVHSSGLCATKHVYGKKKGFSSLDGTPCGKKKWCRRGRCIRKFGLEDPVDGSWGNWLSWSACSQSCGRGVRQRIRKCNSPRPHNGGFYCVGEWKRHSICNPQPCPKGSDSPLQIQCKKFQALLVNGKRYQWTAKQSHANPCELHCVPVVQDGVVRTRKFIQAQDGTPCNHGTRNICIQGKCEHVGCDDKLFSSAREDRCGVCRGDGSSCETKYKSFDQPEGKDYMEAVVIPAQSRNIIIEEVIGSPNFLALRSASGDYFLNGDYSIQWSGEYDVAGASGYYSRRHNKDRFKTKGPITEDLHVVLLYQGKNPGLKVQYDVKKNEITKPRYYHWKYSPWSPCSVTCGQGIQKRGLQCVDQESNSVDERFCKNKYRNIRQRCKLKACPPTWWAGVWHECSNSCGNATKFRAVLCTQIVVDRTEIIDEKKCGKNKPAATIPCDLPLCWLIHPWSNCTSLCGLGQQYRLIQCPGDNESRCDPSTKPITNRTCVGNTCAKWRAGNWGECSATCGNGRQIRPVSCEHHDESMCRPHEKPISTRKCVGIPCPVWRTGDWSECSVTCGKGLETRNVICEHEHVNFTCNALEKPSTVRSCLQKRCSGWTVGKWSPCSTSCGQGIRERKVVCTFKTCSVATRPKHKEICLNRECSGWDAGEWSQCSVSCGEGTRHRNVTCSDPTYPCREDTMPQSVQLCLMPECTVWSFGNWSECSVSCGSGMQTRSVICNAATQEECERDIPETERPCNELPCTVWDAGDWSECSTTCGPGIQKRSVQCADGICSLTDKPNTTRPCLNPDCAVWVTGHWGECSESCGEGTQTRQVYCSDDDDTLCDVIHMPESMRDCFVSRCGAWNVTRWEPCSVKCGVGYTTRDATCIHSDARNCPNKPNVVKMCQETPCSKWSTGPWSPCSVTCNRGYQRRIVSCQGGRCLDSTKPMSRKQCVLPSCGQWIAGNWSECSATCGDGFQIRDVRCSDNDTEQCTDKKPVIKRFCNKQKCPNWLVGEWQSCSVSCGNGTQRRDVTCVGASCSNSTKPVSYKPCYSGKCPTWMTGNWIPCSRSCGGGFQIRMVYCEAETASSCDDLVKPSFKRTCNEMPCPEWISGLWSACSKSCNGGLQTRAVSCNNSHVEDCPAQTKPNSKQVCGEQPCPQWVVSPWSVCSKSCNSGIQTRKVSCNNSHVGVCLESIKPNFSQTCRDVPCPKWSVGQWSECSKSCNGGTQTRLVICENNHVGKCLDENKPSGNRKCSRKPCPTWKVGRWSKCSKTCNGGTQKRTVICENNHVGMCPASDKPDSSRRCAEGPCPYWSAGRWSKCSKSCDGGTQTRTVKCHNSHMGKCPASKKPDSYKRCAEAPCPYWSVGRWSECSKSCDGGTQTRTISCKNNGVGRCLVAKKPYNTRKCSDFACPKWAVGRWSGCSKTCGKGIQIRNVSCQKNNVGECNPESKPASEKVCIGLPCPQWKAGQWSPCSKSCNGGIQFRSLTCNNTYGGKCSTKDKPPVGQVCGKLPCPQWMFGPWRKCSKSCGGGRKTRVVYCRNSNVGSCSRADMPRVAKRCRIAACPSWSAGEWSECSKSCGGGIQIRNISCRNTRFGMCVTTSKPLERKECSTIACPHWSVGDWSVCSKSCNGGIQTRAVTCENGHIGKCLKSERPSTNQECGNVPCPEWSVGEWSKCSKSCGGGIRTRNVVCLNNHAGECPVEGKPFSSQQCGDLPCPKWVAGPWSECSKSCGGGFQTRITNCNNTHVGECSKGERPTTNQTCGDLPCPRWTVSKWSKCSKSCGGGMAYRTVSCENIHVGECLNENKPRDSTGCSNVTCPEWVVGDWSKCSKSCDGGLQNRTVFCKNAHVGECLAGDKPNSTRICEEVPCPEWAVGEWSKCSKSCDGGTQTRTVMCKNHHVGECSENNKANDNQNCNEVPCPQWSVGRWSKCSKSCNGGIKYRTVRCMNDHIGDCAAATKPASTKSCRKKPCPIWSVGQWSKCSKSCGGGVQTRTIVCKNSHVGKCVVKDKPGSKQTCGELPCPKWIVGKWSSCSKTCNGGFQTRSATCANSNVGDCIVAEKPTTRQKCDEVPCPYWSVGQWLSCSKSCNGGTRTRTVRCVNRHVGDCLVAEKPIDRETCAEMPCPNWSVSEWSPCSKSCNGGIQTRSVTCENSHVGACSGKDRPEQSQSCANVPCPEWSVTEWSPCSKSCDGGVQERTVTCNNSHIGECILADKPDLTRKCAEVPCPIWSAGEWSECSKSCNGGAQSRTVTCKHSHIGDCLVKDKPNTTKACGEVPCPKWSASQWSLCSKSCGTGIQTRTVTCEHKDVGSCAEHKKPNSTRTCGQLPCPNWSVGTWSSCSKSCGSGIQSRTVSCENVHVGKCPEKDKPITSQKCGELPCPVWSVGEWSECSKSCDGGIKIRAVVCENHHVGKCPEKDKPVTSQKCSEVPCPEWLVGEWSECSKSCDGGIKTRAVVCENNHVGKCPEKDKPVTSQTCSQVTCPEWSVDKWSECSKSCDGGRQTRTVWCKNNHVGKCPEKDKPMVNQKCSEVPCPEWSVGKWSVCSNSCGGGKQTRTVWCKNNHVGECPEKDKPITSQKCSEVPCPKWIVGKWTECTKSCDSGERTRTVKCSGDSGLSCTGSKPASRATCNDIECPVWIVGNWTKCIPIRGRKCPKGKRSRTVECSWEERRKCDRKTRPVLRERCEAECPRWKTGEWSKCKGSSCARGTTSRRVWCEGGDRNCNSRGRPVNRKSCQIPSCRVWETGEWNPCPSTCGGALRSRTVRCVDKISGQLTQGCERETKPLKYQACALNECPPSPDDIKPTPSRICRQAVKDRYFCNLLEKPSLNLSELCLYKEWKRRCCRSCWKINAQRKKK